MNTESIIALIAIVVTVFVPVLGWVMKLQQRITKAETMLENQEQRLERCEDTHTGFREAIDSLKEALAEFKGYLKNTNFKNL